MLTQCLRRARTCQLRALRKHFCKEKGSAEAPAAPSGPPEHHVAKREYGFMESADIIFSEPTRIPIHRRWDWHAWQLLTALLPSLFIYSMAMYARGEMERLRAKHEEKGKAEETARLEEKQKEDEVQNAQNQLLEERMRSLEAQVRELAALGQRSGSDASAEQPSKSGAAPAAERRADQ